MPTIVCLNHVSSLESPLTETTATLKLKLAAPPPLAALDLCRKVDGHSPTTESKNWGFLQSNSDKECIYPSPKYLSFSKLSPKSLELCTENLGSESGSDSFSDCSSIFSASPPMTPSSNSGDDHKRAMLSDRWNQKKTAPESCRKIKNFPPPLTTMSGSSSLQVRRHREGGRLIIEAVEGPFRNSYLQAERSNGRLKLCFAAAAAAAAACGEAEEEENGDECGVGAVVEEEIERPRNDYESEMEEFDGEINVMEKFQRLSRCKEGGGHGSKGLCSNWKPALWVATS